MQCLQEAGKSVIPPSEGTNYELNVRAVRGNQVGETDPLRAGAHNPTVIVLH